MSTKIELVKNVETLHLRQKVLKPQLPFEKCVNPGDDLASTLHFGLFKNTSLISIATFLHESHPEFCSGFPYRLRGMATDFDFQKKGHGAKLIQHAQIYLAKKGCDFIWCNARETAFPFYKTLGFQFYGDIFDIPGIGPHKVMYKRLSVR